MVALCKPIGGTSGLIVGDFFPAPHRTYIDTTVCTLLAAHQYALGTLAGLDAMVHNVQASWCSGGIGSSSCRCRPSLVLPGLGMSSSLTPDGKPGRSRAASRPAVAG